MKKMKFIYRVALAAMLGGSVMTTSCDGLLDVEPRQSIDADGALSSPEAVSAAINSVYARLRAEPNYGRNLLALSDALADVGVTTNNSGRLIQENNNQPNNHFNAGPATGPGFWQNSYFAINEANLILEGIAAGVPGASQGQLAQWEGEVRFLRALYYFDLVKVYAYIPTFVYEPGVTDEGGIPMPLQGSITSEVAFNRQPSRATIDQVYDQIYTDFNEAIRLLDGRTRGVQYASAPAAQALLSRVALYRGDYTRAVDEATNALNSTVGEVRSGMAYIAGWRQAVNPESMFEVTYAIPGETLGVNVSLQSTYTVLLNLENKNAQGGWGDFIPNATVRNFFGLSIIYVGPEERTAEQLADNNNYTVTRNEDVRGHLYESGNTVRNAGRVIESIKFIRKLDFAWGDNVPVVRKSEMHLNRAEANFRLGNTGEALAELNAFKGLRGVAEVNLTGDDILEEILLERFKEFAFEGHRFFDLKRTGRAIDKRAYLGANAIVLPDDFRMLPPVPQREVDGNENLNQNRGY